MLRKIVANLITVFLRFLLRVEKMMVRWITPTLEPDELKKYQDIIARHERELAK